MSVTPEGIRVAWDAPAGPASFSKVEIVIPRPGSPVYVFSVNDCVEACELHWVGGRTCPCAGVANGCEHPHGPFDPRWTGFLGAWDFRREEYVIAQISRGCWQLSDWLRAANGALRGQAIELYRATRKQRGLVVARAHPNVFKGELPPPINVREILERIWSGKGLRQRKAMS